MPIIKRSIVPTARMNGTFVNNRETLRMIFSHSQPRMHRLSGVHEPGDRHRSHRVWMKGIKAVLSLLILTIPHCAHRGVIKTFLDIRLLLHAPVEVGPKADHRRYIDPSCGRGSVQDHAHLFSEGRVKVTFIVDTILVVMLTEIISLWFNSRSNPVAVAGAILLALGIIRVVAVRRSPAQG